MFRDGARRRSVPLQAPPPAVNGVVISHVTVTAAKVHGNSAVVMSIANNSGGADFVRLGVTSSDAKSEHD